MESRLPLIKALIEEIGLQDLARLEVAAVRYRPIPPKLIEALGRDPDKRDLTEREVEVVKLLADGFTKPEIAERLYVTENTVKTHVDRIHWKLDARTAGQTVMKAVEAGYLPLTNEE